MKLKVESEKFRVGKAALLAIALSFVLSLGASAADAPVRGAYPILTTPYLADGSVDYDSLVKEAQWADAAGVDGVIWPQSDARWPQPCKPLILP